MAQAAWNRRLANAQYISQTFAWPDSATDNARGPCIRRDVCQGESQMPTVTVRAVLRTVLSLPLSWAPLVITFALPVAAQEAPAESAPLQEVVVTGIRRGIEDAIKLKENSGSIVEAISAEDIGKLPDTSIAESISRLPGLTSQRAEGRASAISLRGTDPGFTTTLLNGRICAASATQTADLVRTPRTRDIGAASRTSISSWTVVSASRSALRASIRHSRLKGSEPTSPGVRTARVCSPPTA